MRLATTAMGKLEAVSWPRSVTMRFVLNIGLITALTLFSRATRTILFDTR